MCLLVCVYGHIYDLYVCVCICPSPGVCLICVCVCVCVSELLTTKQEGWKTLTKTYRRSAIARFYTSCWDGMTRPAALRFSKFPLSG